MCIMLETPPFQQAHQLNDELYMTEMTEDKKPLSNLHLTHLPGHPRIALDNIPKLCTFLRREFDLADLERLAPRLWMMTMQSSSNISPLHRQRVKGREVIVTEDPRLHLVWYYNRIYIKPLPRYLLSHAFWQKYLLSPTSPLGSQRETVQRAALGYLRTYYHLIKHESDFRIATSKDLCLIPEGVSWEQFCNFSSTFDIIQDYEVSERYRYGEIRLSRLNFYSKLFLFKTHFQRVDGQYGAYFARFYGSFLFTFGIFSVLLNAMQVEMAFEQLDTSDHWVSFLLMCRWYSIICLLVVVTLSLWLAFLFMFKFTREWIHALGDRHKKKRLAKKSSIQP